MALLIEGGRPADAEQTSDIVRYRMLIIDLLLAPRSERRLN